MKKIRYQNGRVKSVKKTNKKAENILYTHTSLSDDLINHHIICDDDDHNNDYVDEDSNICTYDVLRIRKIKQVVVQMQSSMFRKFLGIVLQNQSCGTNAEPMVNGHAQCSESDSGNCF